jgi:hypothetical protein
MVRKSALRIYRVLTIPNKPASLGLLHSVLLISAIRDLYYEFSRVSRLLRMGLNTQCKNFFEVNLLARFCKSMSKTNKPYRQILNWAFIIVPQSS